MIRKIILGLSILMASQASFALTTLKKIQVTPDGDIEFSFDGKVNRDQLSIEYQNDIIQLTVQNASVYPAKIVPVQSETITKVFAYQYSPKTIRCRITVHGKAESLKSQIQLSSKNQTVRMEFDEPVVAEAPKKDPGPKIDPVLLDHVMRSQALPQIPEKPKAVEATEDRKEEKKDEKNIPLTRERPVLATGKPLPKMGPVFLKLGGVLVLLMAFILILKKLRTSGDQKKSKIVGAIQQITGGRFKKDGKMVQIISTQYIGPKQSIVVVRVAEKILVLGVSHDSINLITQISEQSEASDEDEEPSQLSSVDLDSFSDVFKTQKIKPSVSSSSLGAPSSGVRSRIKSRLEGLKPL